MSAEMAITIGVGMVISTAFGYVMGWLRGHDIGTSRAHARFDEFVREQDARRSSQGASA